MNRRRKYERENRALKSPSILPVRLETLPPWSRIGRELLDAGAGRVEVSVVGCKIHISG